MTKPRPHDDAMFATANRWYEERIRAIVETDENIGKLITIDIETSDYQIIERRDAVQAIDTVFAKNPGTEVLRLRIGYPSVDSFGGVRLMPSKRP